MGFDRKNKELMGQLRKSGNLDDDSAGKTPEPVKKAVKVEKKVEKKAEKKVEVKKPKKWGK